MSRVIIIANQKGGVAKTTTALNLGVGLARKGKQVLLIDNDPQGSLTTAMGYQRPEELPATLATIMGHVIEEEPFELNEGVLLGEEGVMLVPANIELSGIESSLVNVMSSETTLKEYVDRMRPYFDYIIIDCSPNLGFLTVNALTCADEVIIPVQAAYLPVKGLELLLRTISKVKRKTNPEIRILGILITMVDLRTNYTKQVIDTVNRIYGKSLPLFHTMIPSSVRAAEAPALGVSIFQHDPRGKVTEAYEAFTQEVMEVCPER